MGTLIKEPLGTEPRDDAMVIASSSVFGLVGRDEADQVVATADLLEDGTWSVAELHCGVAIVQTVSRPDLRHAMYLLEQWGATRIRGKASFEMKTH